MEMAIIILILAIGFVLFWLGYLTASVMLMSKNADELDIQEEYSKINKETKSEKEIKKGISDMR